MPIIAVGFIFHNHGRNLETGSLNYRSYLDYYGDNHKKKLGFISLYLDGLTPEKASMMSQHFYHFNETFFRNNVVFQLDDHRFLLLCEISKNKEFDRKMIGVIESFQELYKKYRLDYRIIWGTSEGQISNSREFYSFLVYQESLIRINYSKQILIDDFNSFEKINYVMNQLQDINNKKDLNDPRIKVFCQPVLNTRTNEYTSAEALMRFETEKYGMIYPDIFIPIAERIGMIHILTEIILHKTCLFIADLLKEGKDIERISINVSAMELLEKQEFHTIRLQLS